MKPVVKVIFGVITISALSLLGFLGYQDYLAPQPEAPATLVVETEVEQGPAVISAEGKVVPANHIELGFRSAGMIEAVECQEGDLVEAGQVLARLEGQEQMAAVVETAELGLLSAQQELDALYENTDLAKAQADQAAIDARENVKNAQRVLDNLDYTASEEQIAAAQTAVAVAETALLRARKEFGPYRNKPTSDPQRALTELAVYAAERQYAAATKRLNSLQGEASTEDRERAKVALDLAQATLEKAEREAEVLASGPHPDQVSLAQANVENAQAQLAAAQKGLESLVLRAPFQGEVVSLSLQVGDVVTPGMAQVILADMTAWQIETIDLSEEDVGLIQPGMQAVIHLDAFPDQEFKGEISKVSMIGEERRGAITYPVRLNFDPQGNAVRWHMTAFIDILIEAP